MKNERASAEKTPRTKNIRVRANVRAGARELRDATMGNLKDATMGNLKDATMGVRS